MALAVNGGREAIAAHLVDWLAGHITRATREQITRLADEVASDLVLGGVDAMQGIRGTIQEFARTQGMQLTQDARNWIESTAQSISQVGQQLLERVTQDANAGWGEMGAGLLQAGHAAGIVSDARLNEMGQGGHRWDRPVIDRGHTFEHDAWGTHGEELPRLEDLDPMSANGNGRGPPPREPPTDGEAEAQRAAASSGSSFGNPVSKETQISRPPTITYGLQETHTTICPFIGWFSVINPTFASPHVVELRMTSPADVLASPNFNAAPGTGIAWPSGVNQAPFDNSNTQANVGTTFPITTASGAVATERAGWFNYWRQIYEYYTVINCEYEIVIHNPTSANSNAMLMGMDFNSYSDTAGATGNKTPQNATVTEMMAFKNIKWHTVKESNAINPNENATVIRGNYKPGSAKRNIANDGDVKTWNKTNTGATAPDQPTLKELLTMYFYRHPMNYQMATTLCGVNVQYRLKYTVQFKDLRVQARYPTAAASNIAQTIDTDTIMAP